MKVREIRITTQSSSSKFSKSGDPVVSLVSASAYLTAEVFCLTSKS